MHQASHLAVAALATRAAMCHFKDFHVVPDNYTGFAYVGTEGLKFAGTAIGEGDVDLPDCVASLRQAGFDGWLNIEYEGEEDPSVAVARSVEYTRGILDAKRHSQKTHPAMLLGGLPLLKESVANL